MGGSLPGFAGVQEQGAVDHYEPVDAAVTVLEAGYLGSHVVAILGHDHMLGAPESACVAAIEAPFADVDRADRQGVMFVIVESPS